MDAKIKKMESDLMYKDDLIRNEQRNCTNQIVEREKEFISMLDHLRGKAKSSDNQIIRQTNLEAYRTVDSLGPNRTSTIIVKRDNSEIINEIDLIKKEINKH